jgi:hypothetical protein
MLHWIACLISIGSFSSVLTVYLSASFVPTSVGLELISIWSIGGVHGRLDLNFAVVLASCKLA